MEVQDFKIGDVMTPVYLNILGIIVLADPVETLSMTPWVDGEPAFTYGVSDIRQLTVAERRAKSPPPPTKEEIESGEVF